MTAALASLHDALLLDLDGVVYVGPKAVPHAADALREVRSSGVACGFITNNASRTAEAVAEHLTELGIPATSAEVITSPQAAVTVLGDFTAPGSAILVIGGAGIADELSARGYRPVRTLAEDPVAVMQGFAPDLSWRDLAEATFAVRAGLPWIATNLDFTFPTPEGAAPGNGAMVAMVAAVAGRQPDAVAGKPEPPLLEEAISRLASRRPVMIGDRLDTDIEAGTRLGIPSLLVMTGVTTVHDLLHASPHLRPTYVGADLRVLLDAVPEIEWGAEPLTEARCGHALVRVIGSELVLAAQPATIDHLRAAAVLVWARADAGLPTDTAAAEGALAAAVGAALAAP